MKKRITTETVTIASGTDSRVIECQGRTLFAIQTPASISSSAMTFTASDTMGGTYAPVYGDDGTQISITIAQSRFIAFNNKHLALRACQYIKLIMGSSETTKTYKLFWIEE